MSREENLADRILVYLKEHKSLTAMEAVKIFNTTRLGARIFDLRERGYKIPCIMTYGCDPVTKETYKYGTYIYQGEIKDELSSEDEWEWVEVKIPCTKDDH